MARGGRAGGKQCTTPQSTARAEAKKTLELQGHVSWKIFLDTFGLVDASQEVLKEESGCPFGG